MAQAKLSEKQGVTTAKASGEVVAKIQKLVEVRAELGRLEQLKKELTSEIEEAFGESETLVHRNIEVARLSKRSRNTTNEETLKTEFPEVYDATRKLIEYSVIVTLYKETK